LMENARAARTLRCARAVGPWLSVALEGFGRREPSPAPGLLAVGDAASFIDPFTGSGMLMALESGELAAGVVARWLEGAGRSARETRALGELSRDYRALYDARFGARLRLCGWLRRAAFAPHAFVELTARALGQSAGLRRTLARATRTSAGTAPSHY
jgi:flavin-dependent dehydrogenase